MSIGIGKLIRPSGTEAILIWDIIRMIFEDEIEAETLVRVWNARIRFGGITIFRMSPAGCHSWCQPSFYSIFLPIEHARFTNLSARLLVDNAKQSRAYYPAHPVAKFYLWIVLPTDTFIIHSDDEHPKCTINSLAPSFFTSLRLREIRNSSRKVPRSALCDRTVLDQRVDTG